MALGRLYSYPLVVLLFYFTIISNSIGVLQAFNGFFNGYELKCPFHIQTEQPSVVKEAAAISIAAAASSVVQDTIPYPNALNANYKISPATVFTPESGNGFINEYNIFAKDSVLKLNQKHIRPIPNCSIPPANCFNNTNNYYYRTIDGACNNLENPAYGISFARYSRLLKPSYSDGIYAPPLSIIGNQLPNARSISLSLFGDKTENDESRTMASLLWGQFVAHDLSSLARYPQKVGDCCDETANPNPLCYKIPLSRNDPFSGSKKCLKFIRSLADTDANCGFSKYSHVEKISSVTSYIDLSSIYGSTIKENRKVREYSGGLLRTNLLNNRHWMPLQFNVNGECSGQDNYQCFNIPDNRNQFIPPILVIHTIIVREHNRLAKALVHLNPHWNDEKIYQIARKINIAQVQKIIYYDWLPLLIGYNYAYGNGLIYKTQIGEYVNDYDPYANPTITAEFAQGAFRYSHNQIPGWFSMVSSNRDQNITMRLSNYFDRSDNIKLLSSGDNFEALIRGLVTQLQKRPDSNIDNELKYYFDRRDFEEYGTDLKAIDIQRGRDFGVASYNDLRVYCGLPRAYNWAGFAHEISQEKISIMERLYKHPDDVDLSVGGSLENHVPESILGPTFQCIIGKQFYKTRTGDRFFFENENSHSGFTRAQLTEIRKSTLSGLFCRNAEYLKFIQPNALIFPNTRNYLQDCGNIAQINLKHWQEILPTTLR